MATLNSRIAVLEQKKFRSPDARDWTDSELLDFLGLPDGATDEQLHAIIRKEDIGHGE